MEKQKLVGKTVRIISNTSSHGFKINQEAIVSSYDDSDDTYQIKDENTFWCLYRKDFKIVKQCSVVSQQFTGMNKLEYFTAQALTGILAGSSGSITVNDIEFYSERAVLAAKLTLEKLNNEHNTIKNEG